MMHTARANPIFRLSLLAIPLLALVAAAVLLFTWGHQDSKVAADIPHAGLDFSIGVDTNGDTTVDCNTTGGPSKCTFANAGGVFTLKVFLNALGGIANYQGFDIRVNTAGVTVNQSGGATIADAHSWPQCTFQAVAPYNTAYVAFGCAAFNVTSTYTGLIGTVELTCTQTGTLTLLHGAGTTTLTENATTAHAEGTGTTETLAINCGAVAGPTGTNTPAAATPTNTPSGPTSTPTRTNTPGGPTSTATPTRTPAPATATPTRAPPTPTRVPGGRGDVNGDGRTDSTDALWVLWQEAGIVAHVPLPESADVNHDGRVNSIDALFILWIASGAIY